MKQILLFIVAFCLSNVTANAQLEAGSTLPGNITGTDYITGEEIDVQAWLDEGKTVVIDVFATWCGPCWGFHASGWLEEYYSAYGPDGTDEIRILGVEADGSTNPEEMETNGFGQPGSWITDPNTGESIHYNIMDQPDAASTLGIAYYPSLYIIKPNGVLVEIGTLNPNPRYNEEFWNAALGVSDEPYLLANSEIRLGTFCDEVGYGAEDIVFTNTSSEAISSATLDVVANGEVIETVEYSGDEVTTFNSGTISLSPQTFTENTELEMVVTSINGMPTNLSTVSTSSNKYDLTTGAHTVIFTTDFWPIETSWSLTDQDGNEIFAVGSYAGDSNGGGTDANRTFEYDINLDPSVTCLNFNIEDSYGDGLTLWDPAQHRPPGIEIRDAYGVMIKDNTPLADGTFVGEGTFIFESTDVLVSSADLVNVEELESLENMKMFPNPVANDLTLELDFNNDVSYNLSVVDVLGQTVNNLGSRNGDLRESFDLSELPSGMYYLRIATGENNNLYKFNKL